MEYRVELCFVKRPSFSVQVDVASQVEATQRAVEQAIEVLGGSAMPKPVGAVVREVKGRGDMRAYRFAKMGTKPCDIEEMLPFLGGLNSDSECQGK